MSLYGGTLYITKLIKNDKTISYSYISAIVNQQTQQKRKVILNTVVNDIKEKILEFYPEAIELKLSNRFKKGKAYFYINNEKIAEILKVKNVDCPYRSGYNTHARLYKVEYEKKTNNNINKDSQYFIIYASDDNIGRRLPYALDRVRKNVLRKLDFSGKYKEVCKNLYVIDDQDFDKGVITFKINTIPNANFYYQDCVYIYKYF